MNLPPDHVPAWVDKARLCAETCMSSDTIDTLVKQGKLPPGDRIGGKFLWRWKTVEEWLANGGKAPSVSHGNAADLLREEIRKRAFNGTASGASAGPRGSAGE